MVKGRNEPIEVGALVGFTHELSAETVECLTRFQQGIDAYRAQQWDTAKDFFVRASTREIHEAPPSLIMTKRCDDMKENPPGQTETACR